MHKELIKQAFEKIQKAEKLKTGINPSKARAALLISDFILENQEMQFGERRLRDIHKLSVNENNEDVTIKQPAVVQALCELLDYENFEEFKRENKVNEEKKIKHGLTFTHFKKSKPFVPIIIGILIVVLFYFFNNKQHWMIWVNDHYEKTKFDSKKYNLQGLKLYNENDITHFKRVNVKCDSTKFFNKKKEPLIWYGKNSKKELEYFTTLGKHPETGKTLRPITNYMIEKYICVEK